MDKQVNKVTPALFERYPTVEAMAAASVEDVYPMVKSCGFKSKAGNIIAACRIIRDAHGGEVPRTMEELTKLTDKLSLVEEAGADVIVDTVEELTTARGEACSLVHVLLHTGRTHQIRVQCASRKMPLLGDEKYGSRIHTKNIALWSNRLAFDHPVTKKPIDITLDPPKTEPWIWFNQETLQLTQCSHCPY